MLSFLLDVFKATSAIGLLLLVGDFISTFVYHVPEHALGRLHCRVHHESKQTFQHYAVLSGRPLVMLDGFLGALPYFLVAIFLWKGSANALFPVSHTGIILGLLFGEFHVVWRHTTKMGWTTPLWVQRCCQMLCIVTPEEHWVHHEDGAIAFGDIFTFFDLPAQKWLATMISWKKRFRQAKQA